MEVDVVSRQVLVSGTITDVIDWSAPRDLPRVRVARESTGQPLEHVAVRVLSTGFYAVHGDPLRILPPQDIDIRIDVEADGYTAAQTVISFSAADLARVARTLQIGAERVDVAVIGAAMSVEDFALEPLPVTLRGRVSQAEDPATPLANAAVEVTSPTPVGPVFTVADGTFTLGPLPVVPQLTLRITALGRPPMTSQFRPNYRKPMNQGTFALEPA